jgi:hypothetical protein
VAEHSRASRDGPPLKSSKSPAPARRGVQQDAASVTLRTKLAAIKGGLRALYRTLELPGANPLKDAHAALDAAVLAAYGFSAKKGLLAQLLELNLSVAQRLENAEPVTTPGIPATFPNPETLISGDCIRAPATSAAPHSGQK